MVDTVGQLRQLDLSLSTMAVDCGVDVGPQVGPLRPR
jgi:hypothetical protein